MQVTAHTHTSRAHTKTVQKGVLRVGGPVMQVVEPDRDEAEEPSVFLSGLMRRSQVAPNLGRRPPFFSLRSKLIS